MSRNILILECGRGFGGALTSLKVFVDEIDPASGVKIHLLTGYDQDLIQKGGSVVCTGVIPRHRLYGPQSPVEKGLIRLFAKGAGHMAFLLDLMFSGWIYALRIFIYIRRHHIDVLHLNNSILINDYGIVAGFLAQRKVLVQVRAPEYPSKIAKWLALMVDHFLPVSGFVRSSLNALGIAKNAVSIVPEGLNVDGFVQATARLQELPHDMPVSQHGPVIGMVGCLVPWKGHGVFLEACARVLKQTRAEIYIAGETPDDDPGYKNDLLDQALALGISDHIHFLGHCPNVAPVMNACDIMVHASTSPEPFGRVILEAMALGKPVVATAAGGPAEVIDHGKDGILVSPGDAKAMARAILKLMSDDSLRHHMGKAAAQKVSSVYSAENHAHIILKQYGITR